MLCKKKPLEPEILTCKTCVTPWHVDCLLLKPQTLADAAQWECPDCSFVSDPNPNPNQNPNPISVGKGDIVAAIRAIEADERLNQEEKAKRRQELMSGGEKMEGVEEMKSGGENEVLEMLDDSLNCSFCMQLPERPVTTPCGHNFCLKCFQKWVGQGKRTCANCRNSIPPKMVSQPRINAALVVAIRMAKMSKPTSSGGPPKVYHFVQNNDRPDKAFTTERAIKTGKANACSGKIFVTTPPDHFGPILAENDPERNQGVLVGETWEDRMECRQWGAHLPHVAGIAGQSVYGAQSVALSGGYQDDEDHGEWFLYTGSGGRDLSGNKRTNKEQSFDQKFDKLNEALRVSCRKGYPVRVVRSHKEKRSSYAPETGVRYDGVYRIEKCWRKVGIQGFKVCRYLFVRCDNEPAPWTSDEHGDLPRPLPVIKELKDATDITERKGTPSWDYVEEKGCWVWKTPPPESKKLYENRNSGGGQRSSKARRQSINKSVRAKLLKEFSCVLCRKVMTQPLTTPCAHNFCKACLEGAFAGKSFVRERGCEGRRTLRAQKNVMKCPSCSNDISDFLQNPQVNRELMSVIENLLRQSKEIEENAELTEENAELNEENEDADGKDVELSEETDTTNETSDAVVATEISNTNSETVVEDKEKKEEIIKLPLKVDAVKCDEKVAPVETESVKATVGGKTKKTSKRKKASDEICSSALEASAKTRNKKVKSVVDDDDFE